MECVFSAMANSLTQANYMRAGLPVGVPKLPVMADATGWPLLASRSTAYPSPIIRFPTVDKNKNKFWVQMGACMHWEIPPIPSPVITLNS